MSMESKGGTAFMLQAITEANVHFVDGCDKDFLFPKLLQQCVDLTESRIGLIAEFIGHPPNSSPTLHIISFNSNSPFNNHNTTLELPSRLTDTITSRSPSINNNLQGTDLSSSFPSIHSFIGIPLFHHEDLVGMLGLADKPNGYDLSMATFLQPLSTTCSSLMVGYRKHAEQQRMLQMLENARREAEESALAKAHFLSNMSHEIRTPLNGIIGLTSLVLDSPLTFDQREMVETVQSSGDLLLSVVNDILDLAKFEAGKLDLHEVHFDIRACVEACVDVVAIGAERKGIEVLCDITEEVPATMLGDFDRVRQILTNLVGNAVKFTERGEVVVGVRLESAKIMTLQRSFSGGVLPAILKEEKDKNEESNDQQIDEGEAEESRGPKVLHFWVRDTGIGIPKDKKDLLFKMYTQIDPFRTNGTGLGLAICKRLVEAMSGRIWATSEQGVGSCFHFVLPATTSTNTAPYYNPIKGKTMTIFSYLDSHARALEDFARQHAMSSTTHIIGAGDTLTPAQLHALNNTSAAIIDATHADRIVAQLERYFREGRASPGPPSHTPSPPHALDVRALWSGSSLTPASSFVPPSTSALLPAIPPLMLPKATLRVTQLAPTLSSSSPQCPSSVQSNSSSPSSSPSSSSSPSLIPPPVMVSTSGTSTLTTASSTSTSTLASSTTSTATMIIPPSDFTPIPDTQPPSESAKSPTKPTSPTSSSPSSSSSKLKRSLSPKNSSPKTTEVPKHLQRRRSRTGSIPIPLPRQHSPRARRNTSPSKGKFLSLFTSAIASNSPDSLIPSPKDSKKSHKESPKELPKTSPKTTPKELSKELTKELTKELLKSPRESPKEPPAKESPKESLKDAPKESPEVFKPSPTKPQLPVSVQKQKSPLSHSGEVRKRSASAPKPMPPVATDSPPPPASPKKGMQQSKSGYAIAYINATKASSPPPPESPIKRAPLKAAPLSPKISSPSPSPSPSPSSLRSSPSPSPPSSVSQKPHSSSAPSTPRGITANHLVRQTAASNLPASSSANANSNSNSFQHSNLKVITNTGSSSNPNSNSNSPTTPLQSPLAIATLTTSSSGSSQSSYSSNTNPSSPSYTPPSSTPSTPSSLAFPCPIILFVPMSSPPPRTTCTNLFFMPKPIKFTRLSRKLEAVFENPQSPSTPSRIDRPLRHLSGSTRLSVGEDFVLLDHSMAITHPLTIMVGEDNLVGQVVTQRMLSKLGYTAEFYGSGDTLLEHLENRIFDLILLDLRMPGCDGFECARRICNALPVGHRPHIAAVTANILQSDRDLAAAVGFNDYITKPFLLPDLARVLSRCKRLDPLRTIPFKNIH